MVSIFRLKHRTQRIRNPQHPHLPVAVVPLPIGRRAPGTRTTTAMTKVAQDSTGVSRHLIREIA